MLGGVFVPLPAPVLDGVLLVPDAAGAVPRLRLRRRRRDVLPARVVRPEFDPTLGEPVAPIPFGAFTAAAPVLLPLIPGDVPPTDDPGVGCVVGAPAPVAPAPLPVVGRPTVPAPPVPPVPPAPPVVCAPAATASPTLKTITPSAVRARLLIDRSVCIRPPPWGDCW